MGSDNAALAIILQKQTLASLTGRTKFQRQFRLSSSLMGLDHKCRQKRVRATICNVSVVPFLFSDQPIRTDNADYLRLLELCPAGIVGRIETVAFAQRLQPGEQHGAFKAQIPDLA